jgi:hypothetical protein
MSGHRQVKRRIRTAEYEIKDCAAILAAYDIVIADGCPHGSEDAYGFIRQHLLDWRREVADEMESAANRLRLEEELLATMPKNHHASPHDSGDEQRYPDRQKGEKP